MFKALRCKLSGRRAFLVGLSALVATSTFAQTEIYKIVDADGNVVFTDKPPQDGDTGSTEKIILPETNRANALGKTPRPTRKKPSADDGVEYLTRIVSPKDQSTIPMGPGNFSVSAVSEPPLTSREKLQLRLDSAPVGEPQRSSTWQLNNVFRGEHKLTVERINRQGAVVSSSTPITVYVQRPSVR